MSDEIFKNKTFEDLANDIYENQKLKKTQIDLLIQELHSFITTADDALVIAPIIKEYFDVSIKNDEHLVKLAAVIQRHLSNSTGEPGSEFGLSDAEKKELMSTLHNTVTDLQAESDRIESLKRSSDNIVKEN
tara:strand:- start:46 stop:441 length:396 start_codon:yes stop_codon:yes gene_type:complete